MDRSDLKKYEEKFLKNVSKTDSCWFWIPSEKSGDYGTFYTKIGMFRPHRFSYMLYKENIPKGVHVCHNCPGGDNPSCVNPDHLWLGTGKENAIDFYKKNGRHITEPTQILRSEISKDVIKRYKIVCSYLDLSVPRQLERLLRNFVEAQEFNIEVKIKLERKD